MKTTETITYHLIDTPARSIKSVKLKEPTLSFLEAFIGSKMFTSLPVPGIPSHWLYLDDEGWFRERLPLPSGHPEPLPGRAVVFGLGNDGSEQNVAVPIHHVGIRKDGSLVNPDHYPDDLVRVAVGAANERKTCATKRGGYASPST